MHNDGVAQGLSEVPFMQDVERWGVLTIGTGLGNARFTNRKKENGKTRTTRRKRTTRKEKNEKGLRADASRLTVQVGFTCAGNLDRLG